MDNFIYVINHMTYEQEMILIFSFIFNLCVLGACIPIFKWLRQMDKKED